MTSSAPSRIPAAVWGTTGPNQDQMGSRTRDRRFEPVRPAGYVDARLRQKGARFPLGARVHPSIFLGATVKSTTEAGGPAGNTRRTSSGTWILRQAESENVFAVAEAAAKASPAIAPALKPKRSRRFTWRPSHPTP